MSDGERLLANDSDITESALGRAAYDPNSLGFKAEGLGVTPNFSANEITVAPGLARIGYQGERVPVELYQSVTRGFASSSGDNYVTLEFDPVDVGVYDSEGSIPDTALLLEVVDADAETSESRNDNPDVGIGRLTSDVDADGHDITEVGSLEGQTLTTEALNNAVYQSEDKGLGDALTESSGGVVFVTADETIDDSDWSGPMSTGQTLIGLGGTLTTTQRLDDGDGTRDLTFINLEITGTGGISDSNPVWRCDSAGTLILGCVVERENAADECMTFRENQSRIIGCRWITENDENRGLRISGDDGLAVANTVSNAINDAGDGNVIDNNVIL